MRALTSYVSCFRGKALPPVASLPPPGFSLSGAIYRRRRILCQETDSHEKFGAVGQEKWRCERAAQGRRLGRGAWSWSATSSAWSPLSCFACSWSSFCCIDAWSFSSRSLPCWLCCRHVPFKSLLRRRRRTCDELRCAVVHARTTPEPRILKWNPSWRSLHVPSPR